MTEQRRTPNGARRPSGPHACLQVGWMMVLVGCAQSHEPRAAVWVWWDAGVSSDAGTPTDDAHVRLDLSPPPDGSAPLVDLGAFHDGGTPPDAGCAVAGWSAHTVIEEGTPSLVHAAAHDDGRVDVLWGHYASTMADGVVSTARVDAFGALGAVRALGLGAAAYPGQPRVAAGASGAATFTWRRSEDRHLITRSLVDGVLSDEEPIRVADDWNLAATAGGPTVAVVWDDGLTVSRRLPSGSWRTTPLDPDASDGLLPVLATTAGGGRLVAYMTSSFAVRIVYSHDPTTGWEPPLELTGADSAHAFHIDAAADATGRLFVTWGGSDGVHLRVREPDGLWRATDSVDVGSFTAYPRLAVSPAGEVWVAWERIDWPTAEVRLARWASAAGLSTPETVTARSGADGMLPKMFPIAWDGGVEVVHLRQGASRVELWTSRRSGDHERCAWREQRLDVPSLGPLVASNGPGASPAVVAGGGRAVVVWHQQGTPSHLVMRTRRIE